MKQFRCSRDHSKCWKNNLKGLKDCIPFGEIKGAETALCGLEIIKQITLLKLIEIFGVLLVYLHHHQQFGKLTCERHLILKLCI